MEDFKRKIINKKDDIMLILVGSLLLTIISIILLKRVSYLSDWDTVLFISSLVFGAIFTLALIALPFSYYSSKAEVERYYILKETIEQSHSNHQISDLERAALTTQITEYNKDLASVKFWNESIFDIYIYDGLAELDYLK